MVMLNIDFLPRKNTVGAAVILLFIAPAIAQQPASRPPGYERVARLVGTETRLQQAAQTGDIAVLRSLLQRGVSPDARDPSGRTALLDAAAANQISAMKLLIEQGAAVNAASPSGQTPLIEAAEKGNIDAIRLLISNRADLNCRSRIGTALEIAERLGHSDAAAILRQAGARTFGRSVSDSVCVRPWSGDGFCGTVQAIETNRYRIRVATIIGCRSGCEPKPDCSFGKAVGGPDGLRPGDVVRIPSWCITQTDVRP